MATVALTDADVVTFIKTDPLHVGFAAILTASPGQDAPLVAAANNASGPGSGTVPGDPMTSADFFDLIDGAEYNTMTVAQLQSLATIMSAGNVNIGTAPTQAKLEPLLASYSKSLANVRANYTRAACPWEVYFGKGNLANATIIDAARNSGTGNNF